MYKIFLQWMNAVELVQGGMTHKLQVETPQILELGKIGSMSWAEIVAYSFER